MEIKIWTDGSCNNNRKHPTAHYGGWAFVVKIDDELIYEGFGYDTQVTSTQMEMRAVKEALIFCNENYKNAKVIIHSDSAMVVNCFIERWYERWELVNYLDVKNKKLWKSIIKLYKAKINITRFTKVKGHSGIPENEHADFLAGEARKYVLELNGLLCVK